MKIEAKEKGKKMEKEKKRIRTERRERCIMNTSLLCPLQGDKCFVLLIQGLTQSIKSNHIRTYLPQYHTQIKGYFKTIIEGE